MIRLVLGDEGALEKTYDPAVNQGQIDPNESRPVSSDVKRRVEEIINTDKNDAKTIWTNMTPVAQQRFKEAIGRKANPIKKMVEVGRDLRRMTRSEISKKDEENLKSWFGPNVNTVLDHFYTERKKNDVLETQSDDTPEGDSAERMGEENDWESPLSEDNSSVQTSKKTVYVQYSKAKEYFDTSDEVVRFSMQRRADDEVVKRTASDDASRHTVRWVGMVDREIEKAAEAAGRDLTDAERSEMVDRLMAEHYNDRRPSGQGLKHEQALKAYEKRSVERVDELNKKFKALRVESDSLRGERLNLSKEQVDGLKMRKLDHRSPKAYPSHGTIYLDDGTKDGYPVNASSVIRVMFGATDGSAGTFRENANTAESLHDLLLTGLTSIINSNTKFTGQIGIRSDPEQRSPTWLKPGERLPGNLKLKTDKDTMRPVRLKEAYDARKQKEIDDLNSKYTPTWLENMLEEMLTNKTAWLASELRKVATCFPSHLTKEQRKEIIDQTDLYKAKKPNRMEELYHLLPPDSKYRRFREAVVMAEEKYKNLGDPRLIVSFYEGSKRNKWSDTNGGASAFGDDNIVPSERDFSHNDSGDVSERAINTSFREDNPANLGPKAKPIHRDEQGFVNTNNATMKAANMAGRENGARRTRDRVINLLLRSKEALINAAQRLAASENKTGTLADIKAFVKLLATTYTKKDILREFRDLTDEKALLLMANAKEANAEIQALAPAVKAKGEPKEGGTLKVFDEAADGGLSVEEVMFDLRSGVTTAMVNLRKAIDAGKHSEVDAMLLHLGTISEMKETEVLATDNTIPSDKAEVVIRRAKEAHARARAIVDQGVSMMMWSILRSAHRAKWGRATFRLFVNRELPPKYRSDPRVLRLLELWPVRYEDMKEWPEVLLPETRAPV